MLSWPFARIALYGRLVVVLLVVLLPLGPYLRFGAWAGSGVLIVTVGLVGLYISPLVTPGVRVTPRSQPDLARLVAEVASAASVRRPDRVWLVPDGQIRARVLLWRRELLVGEALLVCLSRSQAAALVAHELATLDYRRPRLVGRLLAIWVDTVHTANDDAFDGDSVAMGPSVARRLAAHHRVASRLATGIAPVAAAVHRRADASAATCGGGYPVAAAAFAQALAVSYEFPRFPFQGPGRRPEKLPAVTDLMDGWRRWVAHGIQLSSTGPGWEPGCVDNLGRVHPDLLPAFRPLATVAVTPTLAADAVPLKPLPTVLPRRRQYGRDSRWTTFAAIAPQVWIRRAAADAAELRRQAAIFLHRDAVDDLEVTTVLLAWEVDESEAGVVPGVARGSDPVRSAPPGVGYLVEDRLLPRGFRLEHPAVRGVLLGPGGQRVDARHLIGGTYLAPDLTELRAVFDGA